MVAIVSLLIVIAKTFLSAAAFGEENRRGVAKESARRFAIYWRVEGFVLIFRALVSNAARRRRQLTFESDANLWKSMKYNNEIHRTC